MTLWGGTPDYTCQLTVAVNGTNLPTANPFVFGATTDMNALFVSDAPCAYGSGYGVWLVTLPVPGGMLRTSTNGSTNTVSCGQKRRRIISTDACSMSRSWRCINRPR